MLLLFGGLAVFFALFLGILAMLGLVTVTAIYGGLISIMLSFVASFYALVKLAMNGHLTTDLSRLLKM
jgi:hypothetical protein